MKKLLAGVFIGSALIVILIVSAFFYIDISGHKRLRYKVSVNEKFFGYVEVDRYVTEDKVIYKSFAKYPYTAGYPSTNKKLSLKKQTMMPLSFSREDIGVNGQKRKFLLFQEGDRTDYLFLEHPRFFRIREFETGEKTLVFSPDEIMFFMPIIDNYNFWKKGTQFFEVMIPVGEAVPPLRDKIAVRYTGDEYIPIMGRRIEAESFTVTAPSLPEAKISVSKYSHEVLRLKINDIDLVFILVDRAEAPGEKIKTFFFTKIMPWSKAKKAEEKSYISDEYSIEKKIEDAGDEKPDGKRAADEVFFDSKNLILAGRIIVPDGKEPFPGAILVPKDGPMTGGEKYLLDLLGDYLLGAGFLVMTFDRPGQGKSQGNFIETGSEENVRDILSAVRYLEEREDVAKGQTVVVGHEGGGYLAMQAALLSSDIRACVMIGVSTTPDKTDLFRGGSELHGRRRLGPFDATFLETVEKKIQLHRDEVTLSDEKFSFFLRIKIPVEGYKELLLRHPYEAIFSLDKPFLLVLGQDDRSFNPEAANILKRVLSEKKADTKIAIFRKLGNLTGRMPEFKRAEDLFPDEDVFTLIRDWVAENRKDEQEEDLAIVAEKTPS